MSAWSFFGRRLRIWCQNIGKTTPWETGARFIIYTSLYMTACPPKCDFFNVPTSDRRHWTAFKRMSERRDPSLWQEVHILNLRWKFTAFWRPLERGSRSPGAPWTTIWEALSYSNSNSTNNVILDVVQWSKWPKTMLGIRNFTLFYLIKLTVDLTFTYIRICNNWNSKSERISRSSIHEVCFI